MEIKIDTKKDSPDDIKKAIDLLQRIVEASGGSYGSSEISPTSEVGAGMANLFGDTPVLGETPSTPGPDDESKDEEEGEANIEIIPY